ncbi:MAG TPA: mevalonate kinase [Anaerolineales bacterium]|nr:mevalonate kinase [Anaerolineales bacterium]
MTKACAPGKIILLGEHAVVYGRPALAVPVRQVQACARIEPAGDGAPGGVLLVSAGTALHAWLDELPAEHPLAAICRATLAALAISEFAPLRLSIESTIPVASGLGSSAAVSVAVARALNQHFGGSLRDGDISDLAYEVERIHHGTPSGIDNTVVSFDRPVLFQRGERPVPLAIGGTFTFLIADTGIAAPTAEAVGLVRQRWSADPARLEAAFDEIAAIVLDGRQALQNGDHHALGQAMRRNHGALVGLGVSSVELDRLVQAAEASGALGAKMSGGGMGGHMIALVGAPERDAVAASLNAAGAASLLRSEVGP